ncbi:MAG: YciI family protein [Pirellulales bacterium]
MRILTPSRLTAIVTLMVLLSVTGAATIPQAASLLKQIRTSEKKLDDEMIMELGADDLGMRKYVMAFLKTGPNRDQDAEASRKLMQGHMDNIGKMAKEGKLILAGPFMDNGSTRGIYVFNTDNLDEAKKWTETDPAIQAGRLEMELHPWYGSATLLLVNDLHNRVQKKSFGE